ncbi:MAG TPA: hypothetical protein PLD55_12795 [bacterium]|jgi:hypothetical protein|nr:hypothetical protein [bacterium]HNZ53710.1 hypothetical protein [bacterium]HOB71200.1 hypothetical protein [bacterium]HOG44099.1 hypothetical protein [bacterium]HPY15807.1 hypothetical protein [bacterium]
MKRGKEILIGLLIIAVASVLFFVNKDEDKNKKSDILSSEVQKNEKTREKIVSNLATALGRSMKQSSPEELEKVFNERTELTPLPFDEVEKLEGDNLQKRFQELDAKLDHAIQKHPDLPPPPEWYLREREYLGNKFYATVGKSRYETELTQEQKERQQRYLSHLEQIRKTGEIVSDEELAKTKEQILGE